MAGTARAGPAARPGHLAGRAPGRAVLARQAGPVLVRPMGTGAPALVVAPGHSGHRRRGRRPARHGRPGLPRARAGPANTSGATTAAMLAGADRAGAGQAGVARVAAD